MRFGSSVLINRGKHREVRATLIGARGDQVLVRLDQCDLKGFGPRRLGEKKWIPRAQVQGLWSRTPWDNRNMPRKIHSSDRGFMESMLRLGRKFFYEPFELPYKCGGDRTYVPDFFLPDKNLIVELKGASWNTHPCNRHEIKRKLQAARDAGFNVMMVVEDQVVYENGWVSKPVKDSVLSEEKKHTDILGDGYRRETIVRDEIDQTRLTIAADRITLKVKSGTSDTRMCELWEAANNLMDEYRKQGIPFTLRAKLPEEFPSKNIYVPLLKACKKKRHTAYLGYADGRIVPKE